MADLQPIDVLLVNRAGVDYKVTKANLMATVLDTDELLVNRAGVDYKATYADVKKGFGPQQINPAPGDWTFNPAIVSGTGTQGDPFVITPATVPQPGGTAQSAQTLTLTGLTPNDLVEWTDHSVGAGTRFEQPLGLVPAGGQVDLRLQYLDTPNSTASQDYTGDLQIGTTYFRWVVTQVATVAPDVNTVTLSDVAGGDRFTSVAFPVSATMTEDGVPTSTKKLKAYVEGALKASPLSSAITQVNSNVLTFTDNTQLANFAPGDAVTEVGGGGDATGTVGSVDTTANTITLSASAGTWDVGSQVKGPLKTVNKKPESDEIVGVAADTPAAGQTTLTLKTDKDLRDFASGDAVNQDSAFQLRSDVITAVGGTAAAPVLTVASDKDLANFKPGDSVKNNGISPILYGLFDGGAKYPTSTSLLTLMGAPTGIDYTNSTSYQNIPNNPFTAGKDEQLVLDLIDGATDITLDAGASSGWQIHHSDNLGGPWVKAVWYGSPGVASNQIQNLSLRSIIGAHRYAVVSWVPSGSWVTYAFKLQLSASWVAAFNGLSLGFPFATGVVGSVDQAAKTITLSSANGTWQAHPSAHVLGPSSTASGTVGSADPVAKTITLSSSTGTWTPNAGKWVIGPTKPSSSVKLYCKLDAAGAVSDLQSADPGFTAWTPAGTGPYTGSVTFPATLPTGQPPDTDLPAGTSLTVEVEASNTAGSDSAKSNTITPA